MWLGMEYIEKLLECFKSARLCDDGLIHMTDELRNQIVEELEKILEGGENSLI